MGTEPLTQNRKIALAAIDIGEYPISKPNNSVTAQIKPIDLASSEQIQIAKTFHNSMFIFPNLSL
ncbi:hypothetical protein THF1C08_320091 [Vibrio jasicida]|uniref:Uncharacterized protein n=1 Tax=Vibrio jasicida TaxID=766224 RepID=A0AAU9QPI7_9VIBR|nr:hypothetical protein THF1C08_320091 [Vibrio jasicida]CAH1597534.1 hypothetical protein THF1A12_320091 [Vibrio jasicida]